MNPGHPARRPPDPPNLPGLDVAAAHGQIVLTDTTSGAHVATLPPPHAVGLACALAQQVGLLVTDIAPELATALWSAAGQLNGTIAAWQPDLYPAPGYWHPDPHADRPPPAVPHTVTAVCDNHSVGVVIPDGQGRLLLIRRLRPPVGIAPVAGHIDEHGSAQDAAVAEVAEEVGLTVTHLTWLTGRWRSNVCRRQHGPWGPGHQWSVYQAEVTGSVVTAPGETGDARWYTRDEVQQLADRTVAHARGEVDVQAYAAAPGLEPVWVEFLVELGLVDVPPAALAEVNRLASRSPYPSGDANKTPAAGS